MVTNKVTIVIRRSPGKRYMLETLSLEMVGHGVGVVYASCITHTIKLVSTVWELVRTPIMVKIKPPLLLTWHVLRLILT